MSFDYGQCQIFDTVDVIRSFGSAMAKVGKPVILVPLTSGLHAGHIALIRAAKRIPGAVVVVAFSGDEADFERLRRECIDALFTYSEQLLWPHGMHLRVGLGTSISGEETLNKQVLRVLALIGITSPGVVILGEKDYEALVNVQRAITDLHLNVKVQGVLTVRLPDGLAISLRNTQLSTTERERALALSAALTAGVHVAEQGASAVLATARSVLTAAGVEPEYLEIRDLLLGPAPTEGNARLFVGARIGQVLLEDNVGLPLGIGFKNLV